MQNNKAEDTQPEYVTLIALPQQKLLLERASVLRYIHMPLFILPISTNIGMCRVIWIKITNITFHNKKCDGN
jgi:hypothetical protein